MSEALIVHGVAVLITAIAAVTDWRTGHIPNWLTLPPIALAPIVHGVLYGWRGLLASGLGILLCGLVPYFLFRKGAMAGGDVKLFAAVGGIAGVLVGFEAEMFAFIAAAFFSLARLAWHGKLFKTIGNTFFLGLNPILPSKWRREVEPELMSSLRLGGAIFAGTLVAVMKEHPILWM
jgi:prepilin peptidase CpaA